MKLKNRVMKPTLFTVISLLGCVGIIFTANSLDDSLSEKGIDILRLQQPPYNLLGRKVSIGQIEVGRPKKFGLDKLPTLHKKLSIKRLFFQALPPVSDTHIDNHAQMVSGVMISHHKRLRGIAPLANLYIGAIGSLKTAEQPEECITTQNVALQNSGSVRAINLSFGESLDRDQRNNPVLDGNALLTQCLDWSARFHNVLYLVAGNQGKGGIPIPTDNYNGITVAYSRIKDNSFRKVDFANLSLPPIGISKKFMRREINFGNRNTVGLLAPGHQIEVYNMDGKIETVTGSSFAAPHVTATVALLNEAGNRFLEEKHPLWTQDYRQHEVMKAILMTSADKLRDNGDGNLLGMTRNVLTQRNENWLVSDAYFNSQIPLHMQMGAGHLNAMRAYQQLIAGQWTYKKKVASQGWNYTTIDYGTVHDYVLHKTLKGKSFISITIAWDRLVNLQDVNQNQKYDIGEKFSDRGLNNLDIELVNNQNNETICRSVSQVDSVEHIFCQVPNTGRYTIRVKFKDKINLAQQKYGIAWHGVNN